MCGAPTRTAPLASPETVQPLLSDRKSEIIRDGDEFLAVDFLDPRRDRINPMRGGVVSYLFERSMLREAFEGAPRGEDQARFAALLAIKHVLGGDPGRAGAFALDDLRSPCAFRRPGNVEQSVEAPDRVELGDPARERGQRAGVNRQA